MIASNQFHKAFYSIFLLVFTFTSGCKKTTNAPKESTNWTISHGQPNPDPRTYKYLPGWGNRPGFGDSNTFGAFCLKDANIDQGIYGSIYVRFASKPTVSKMYNVSKQVVNETTCIITLASAGYDYVSTDYNTQLDVRVNNGKVTIYMNNITLQGHWTDRFPAVYFPAIVSGTLYENN